jgi:hypothetical protein
VHFQCSCPLYFCARLQFTVIQGLFVCSGGGGGESAQRLCWFILGELREFCMTCGAHLFVLSNVSQAGLELAVAAAVVVMVAALPYWLCSGSQLLGAIQG